MTHRPVGSGDIREAGDAGLLLQLEPAIDPAVNARAIGIADAIRSHGIRGLRDVVPTYRSVAVYFDPLVADVDALRGALERAASDSAACVAPDRPVVEIPVVYGGDCGPDLEEVAAFAGLTPAQVIERHAASTYRVFMLGFLPGFPYMGIVSPEIAMPRRATPRVRVPRGSVGIAGAQTGIYPTESPGGWRIIGRTPVSVFDVARTPPALLAPGDRVRFVSESRDHFGPPESGPRANILVGPPEGGPHMNIHGGPRRLITILRPGLFTTVQDSGRWGFQAHGVPVSGAMDVVSHRTANALVGNDAAAATLEATLIGPELRVEQETAMAIAGADLSATVDGAPVPVDRATRCGPGSVIRFGERRSGVRLYLAFDGGIDVPVVLGSRATHVRSALGGFSGRALAPADQLALGAAGAAASPRVGAMMVAPVSGGIRVRALPGPQDDLFPRDALDVLQHTRFTVASQSDRMGYRLQGGRLPRRDGSEMISDATFPGGIQVPASGEPILLLADRQTTGGYPQIATVITADLPRVAQLAPGDWIEFEPCTRAQALKALEEQERALRAYG